MVLTLSRLSWCAIRLRSKRRDSNCRPAVSRPESVVSTALEFWSVPTLEK